MSKFKRVLIIDDDALSNMIAKMAVQHSGIAESVAVVSGAKQGLDVLVQGINDPENSLPDLILLDLNMPIMDGWEFLEEYKKMESQFKHKITMVIVSSSVFSKDIERAKSYSQVMDYISKPLKVEILKDLHKKVKLASLS